MSIAFEAELTEAIKDAMRAKDQVKLDCLRAMKSALKYKHVEKSQADVTTEEAIAVFQSLIKQRKEAFEQFDKAGRADQAAKEQREISIISEFLPKALSDDEVNALIKKAIEVSGAKGPQDMGKVMKELKSQILGRADAKVVSDRVKAALSA